MAPLPFVFDPNKDHHPGPPPEFDKWHGASAERRFEWWIWYEAYLQSGAWRDIRERVLERDKFKCDFCGDEATQVHHLTYKRVGYEKMSDLVSVCVECHEAEHERW